VFLPDAMKVAKSRVIRCARYVVACWRD